MIIKMKKIITMSIIGLLVIMNFMITPVSSEENTTEYDFYVDDDFNETNPGWNWSHFDNIQDSLDAAENGYSIFVYNGIYNENLDIKKEIALEGENNEETIIRSGFDTDTIQVLADNVEISNLKIISKGSLSKTIYSKDYNYLTITNNYLEGDWIGIRLYSSNNNKIQNNYLYNCSISIHGSNHNNISKNTIIGKGLSFARSNDNEILYNTIKSTDTGIATNEGTFNNFIRYNIVRDCGVGINVGAQDQNIISYNDFKFNKYMNVLIQSSECDWFHNYWGGTERFPRARILQLPKIIVGFGYPKFFIDFDWHPAIRPNCDFNYD